MPQTAAGYALGVWAGAVAWSDLRRRRIPNVLLVLMLVPAVLALVVDGQGLLGRSALSSCAGLLIAGLPLLPGYAGGQMGAGDVKFSACLGFVLGAAGALEMLLISALLIGAASFAALQLGSDRARRLPAAPMFAAAFLLQVLYGRLLPMPGWLS